MKMNKYNKFIQEVETDYNANLFMLFNGAEAFPEYEEQLKTVVDSKKKFICRISKPTLTIICMDEDEKSIIYSFILDPKTKNIEFKCNNMDDKRIHEVLSISNQADLSSFIFFADTIEDVVDILFLSSYFFKRNPLNQTFNLLNMVIKSMSQISGLKILFSFVEDDYDKLYYLVEGIVKHLTIPTKHFRLNCFKMKFKYYIGKGHGWVKEDGK